MLTYIFKGFLLVMALCRLSFGQEISDSLKTSSKDTVLLSDTVSHPVIRRLEFSLDYLKLASLALKTENKGELGLGIITGLNLGLIIEGGYSEKMPEAFYTNADYRVSGYYGRVGLSYHYAYDPGTNFFVGAKYGMSRYQDRATYVIQSSLWDDYTGSFERSDLTGQWVEIIAGSESRFKGHLYLGFIFRFRALVKYDDFSPFNVYAIPGYGRTMDKTIPAVNLYIKYILSFEK